MPIKKVAQIRSESGTKLVGQTCLADIGEPGQPDCWCLQPLYKPCCWGTLAYLCYKNCAKKTNQHNHLTHCAYQITLSLV